jgi:hypothetical protein
MILLTKVKPPHFEKMLACGLPALVITVGKSVSSVCLSASAVGEKTMAKNSFSPVSDWKKGPAVWKKEPQTGSRQLYVCSVNARFRKVYRGHSNHKTEAKTGTASTGIFTDVLYIQRIATKGGKAPVTPPAFIDQTIDVKYKAVYRFTKKNA